MVAPFDLLRSGFPYYMTLGQRRVTSNPMDIGFGKENVYVLTRGGSVSYTHLTLPTTPYV